MIFVTGRNKRAIEDHFDRAYELENELERAGKQALLDELQASIPSNINCIFIRQGDALASVTRCSARSRWWAMSRSP